jgi:hypothetical protein
MSKPATLARRGLPSMPDSPNATPPRPPRSLSVKQPEWAAALTKRQRRAGAHRRARAQSRREQARQHAVVATWLRDLIRKG